MGAIVRPTVAVLRLLPGPLLKALDAWSQRLARRRWEQRHTKWRQRQATAAK